MEFLQDHVPLSAPTDSCCKIMFTPDLTAKMDAFSLGVGNLDKTPEERAACNASLARVAMFEQKTLSGPQNFKLARACRRRCARCDVSGTNPKANTKKLSGPTNATASSRQGCEASGTKPTHAPLHNRHHIPLFQAPPIILVCKLAVPCVRHIA